MQFDSIQLFYLALLGAAISVVTAAIKSALPEHQHRILPLVPLLLGAAGGPLTGLVPGESLGSRVIWGILAGAFSGQAYEAIKRLVNAQQPPIGAIKNEHTKHDQNPDTNSQSKTPPQ